MCIQAACLQEVGTCSQALAPSELPTPWDTTTLRWLVGGTPWAKPHRFWKELRWRIRLSWYKTAFGMADNLQDCLALYFMRSFPFKISAVPLSTDNFSNGFCCLCSESAQLSTFAQQRAPSCNNTRKVLVLSKYCLVFAPCDQLSSLEERFVQV